MYFDDAVTLSTEGEKATAIEVIAQWHEIIISETNPDPSFTINASPTPILTPDGTNPIVL